ncbi:MAG: adenosylcobinamide-GDP ribazoletransferase [Pseudomonadota bacterium]
MGFDKSTFIVLAARLCTAVRFLTLMPIAWRAEDDSRQFADCLVFFAVVGVIIGAVGASGVFLLSMIFPQPVVIALGLAYLAFISGCLHLDGLSDSADGLLSSRPKEVCLEIMKDSRAGAMGVVVVVMVLLMKYAALSALSKEGLLAAFFLMPLAGRCAILLTMASLPYAREEGGLGSLFYSGNSKKAAVGAMIFLLFFVVILTPSHTLPILVGFLVVTFLFNRWCKAKIGGATGDTLGAVCELTEMIVAVSLTASFTYFFL